MATALVIHGHFYQPPRENPWTLEVEREPGAEPHHDWNERIYHECYRPNAYARVFDDHGRVSNIVNNYRHLSFNFGPTLLSWLERHHSLTYARILEADRESAKLRGGHGNAIAQGYNHMILPLANERDRITQVRWGIADFRWRFGRMPESMWLPETAANELSLGTLIDEGMKFVILSPYQAARVRKLGDDKWHDARGGAIDTGIPYRYFHHDGSRRHIDIFFYDGPSSRGIAFEGALASSRAFVDNFLRFRGGAGRLASAATDGESYGHHSKWGDRCLAHAMEHEAPRAGFWVTNYAEYLEHHPPTHEVEVDHGPDGWGSSWSCSHGVGRWYRDCGCHTGGAEGWNQAWRGPLRQALDVVREQAIHAFESRGSELFTNAWDARNEYIEVVLDPRARERFLERVQRKRLGDDERVTAFSLLEMQRWAQLMYTSCGWFFSDISGIESTQVLKYAGRVLDHLDELGFGAPRAEMLEVLAEAKSNKKDLGNGADIYHKLVEPVRVTPHRVAAHIAITSLVDHTTDSGDIAGFTFARKQLERRQDGRVTLLTAEIALKDRMTGRAHARAVCGMHFGGVDFYCVVQDKKSNEQFQRSMQKLWASFPTASLPALIRLARDELDGEEFGLEHVLPGGREHVSEIVYGDLLQRFSEQYARLYEENRRTIEMLQAAGFELPKELRAAAELTLGRQFEDEIRRQRQSQDPASYRKALEIAEQVDGHGYEIDRRVSSQIFSDMINARVLVAVTHPDPENVEAARSLIDLTRKLGVGVDLDPSQEAVWDALRSPSKPLARQALLPLSSALGLSSNA